MEAAEDVEFLRAMNRAHIKGALSASNPSPRRPQVDLQELQRERRVARGAAARLPRARRARARLVHLRTAGDRPDSFDATLQVAEDANLTFAQFVMLTPFPGTLDFAAWEKSLGAEPERVGGIPIIATGSSAGGAAKNLHVAPVMTAEEIRRRTQEVWDQFYSLPSIWRRRARRVCR
jgi:hypothetical protein